MEFTLNHHLYYDALQNMPISVLECLVDRFMEADVYQNIPESLRIAYGRFLAYFAALDNAYLLEKSSPKTELHDTLASLINSSIEAVYFVRDEYDFIKSLNGPINGWDLETLGRAADDFEFWAKKFTGVCELAPSISMTLPDLNNKLLRALKVNFLPASKAFVVPTVKLLFSLLKIRAQLIHVNSKFGVEGMGLFGLFNKHLWPKIKEDAEMSDAMRGLYPIAYSCLEFIVNGEFFSATAESVSDLHSFIFALSDNPSKEFNQFADTLLLKECTHFFELAIKDGRKLRHFDETPFYNHLLRQAGRFEELDTIDRRELRVLFSIFLQTTSNTSDTNVSFLKLLNLMLFN